MVVPIFFSALTSPSGNASSALKASAMAFFRTSSLKSPSLSVALSKIELLMAEQTVELATSPASCPPIPSQRMKRRSESFCCSKAGNILSS